MQDSRTSLPTEVTALPAPESTAGTKHAAKQLLDGGNNVEAAKLLARFVDEHPDDSEGVYLYGTACYRAADDESAESAFRRLMSLEPTDARAAYSLALPLIRLGRRDEAKLALRRALELDPGLTRARERLQELEAQPAHVANLPSPVSEAGGVAGTVEQLQHHTDVDRMLNQRIQVVTFRLAVTTAAGQLLAVPVVMRGPSVEGPLANGDLVQVAGPWQPGVTLRPKVVRNLTTGGLVEVKGSTGRVLMWATLIAFLIGFAVFVVVALQHT
jgi:hypothetical protein